MMHVQYVYVLEFLIFYILICDIYSSLFLYYTPGSRILSCPRIRQGSASSYRLLIVRTKSRGQLTHSSRLARRKESLIDESVHNL